MKNRPHLILLSLLLSAGIGTNAIAAPGDIEPGFEPPVFILSMDEVVDPFSPAFAATQLSTGEILVYNYTGGPAFNAVEGSVTALPIALDPATGAPTSSFELALAFDDISLVHVLSDGSMLVLGRHGGYQDTIYKFAADGSLDPDFQHHTDLSGRLFVEHTDGSLYLNGVKTGGGYTVKRLHPNGQVDESYLAPEFDSPIFGATLDDEGRLYAVGYFRSVDGNALPGMARLFPDGSLDAAFKPFFVHDEAGYSHSPGLRNVNIQADGKLIVSGRFRQYAPDRSQTSLHIIRMTEDGQPDEAFNATVANTLAGSSLFTFGPSVRDAVLQEDGSLIVVANGLMKILPDGTADPEFASSVFSEEAFRIEQLADGRLVVPGMLEVNGTVVNRVAAFDANGNLDPGFTASLPQQSTQPDTILVNDDGSVWLTGTFNRVNGQDAQHVARLFPDGTPVEQHPDFSSLFPGGKFSASTLTYLLPAPGGTVYLSLTAIFYDEEYQYWQVDSQLVRCFADGTVDPGFTSERDYFTWEAIALSDGSILHPSESGDVLSLDRILPDGTVMVASLEGADDIVVTEGGSKFQGQILPLAEDRSGNVLVVYINASGDSSIRRFTDQNQIMALDPGFTPIPVDIGVESIESWAFGNNGEQIPLIQWSIVRPPSIIPSILADTYLLAGDFSQAGGHQTDGLAAFDSAGRVDDTKALNLGDAGIAGRNPYITSVAEDESGRLYIVGEFETGDGPDGIACLNPDFSLNPAFQPAIERVEQMQRYFPKVYPKVLYHWGVLHLTGPYRQLGEQHPHAYWQLEPVEDLAFVTSAWANNPFVGWVYGYSDSIGISAAMGTLYLGQWPHLYLYENGWGWLYHFSEGPDGTQYYYHPTMEWIAFHPKNSGWFAASGYGWDWFTFKNPAPVD